MLHPLFFQQQYNSIQSLQASKMKSTATVVLGLVAMSEAKKGGKPSTASTKAAKTKSISLSYDTKSAKSKAVKTQCIDTDSSLSYSAKSGKAKSGKADLSMSMSMSSTACLPCSLGLPVYDFDCFTDVGFCTYTTSNFPTIDQCVANSCVPDCSWVEPICDFCSTGNSFGANCPDGWDVCEFQWSADAPPTCKISDCVPEDPDGPQLCNLCTKIPAGFGCPAVDGYCQINTVDGGNVQCVTCSDTECPDFQLSQCLEPPAGGGARRLEMSSGGQILNDLFQW